MSILSNLASLVGGAEHLLGIGNNQAPQGKAPQPAQPSYLNHPIQQLASLPVPQAQPQYNPSMGGAPVQPSYLNRMQGGQITQPQLSTIDAINHATGSPYGDFTVPPGTRVAPNYPASQAGTIQGINQATGLNALLGPSYLNQRR